MVLSEQHKFNHFLVLLKAPQWFPTTWELTGDSSLQLHLLHNSAKHHTHPISTGPTAYSLHRSCRASLLHTAIAPYAFPLTGPKQVLGSVLE